MVRGIQPPVSLCKIHMKKWYMFDIHCCQQGHSRDEKWLALRFAIDVYQVLHFLQHSNVKHMNTVKKDIQCIIITWNTFVISSQTNLRPCLTRSGDSLAKYVFKGNKHDLVTWSVNHAWVSWINLIILSVSLSIILISFMNSWTRSMSHVSLESSFPLSRTFHSLTPHAVNCSTKYLVYQFVLPIGAKYIHTFANASDRIQRYCTARYGILELTKVVHLFRWIIWYLVL